MTMLNSNNRTTNHEYDGCDDDDNDITDDDKTSC